MNTQNLLVSGVIAGLLTTTSASAGLIGTNVTLNYHYLGITTTDTLAVTNGVEVSCLGGGTGNANVCSLLNVPIQSIDIGAFSIHYSYSGDGGLAGFNNIGPNGFDFQNLNPGTAITSVALTTDIAGLDLGRVTFSTSSIQVDMHALSMPGPGEFTLNISTATVPEPTSLTLLGTGALLVLGYAQRYRNTPSRRAQVDGGQSAPA